MVAKDDITNCNISDVYFEACCCNNRHVHPSNQVLIVKEGVCFYQEEGKAVQQIPVDGVINILPGVKHWHGASPDAPMTHIAININTEKEMVNWMKPVSDKQYKA